MRLAFLGAALLLALCSAIAFAAEPLRVEILSVQEQQGHLTAALAVYGPDGLPVPRLPSGSIEASLDGAPLPVTSLQTSTTARPPIGVVLVVDVSGSMQGNPITQARSALTDFVNALEPSDQIAVLAFDTNVRLLQDFTSDKKLATAAVSKLTPLGDTALYDAVIQGARKAAEAPADRKLVVLLTDGVATVNVDRRATSLEEARASGAGFVAIGLGNDLDRAYLGEIASVSGGRFLEAPTPAALKQTYANLAAAIKTQFIVSTTVPESVDRTVPAKLKISATLNGVTASAEKAIPALAGAVPPPLSVSVSGLVSGMRVSAPVIVQPGVPQGASGITVEYVVDGQSVFRTAGPDYGYQLDPATLSHGTHLVKIIETDSHGRKGEKEVPFKVVSAGSSSPGVPRFVAIAAPLLLAFGALGYLLLKRRKPSPDGYSKRIKPWKGKIPDVAGPMNRPPGEWKMPESRPAPLAAGRPMGRVILIDETMIRTGGLDSILEYEIGASPLTLGSATACDIVISDPEGRIGGEEARLWVQRDRLVYHKLTTLSAMATEGVTSGWQFLDTGEDIRVGPYRLTFQLDVVEPDPLPPPPKMRELWPVRSDDAEPLGASSD